MNFIRKNIFTFAAVMLVAMFGLVDSASAASVMGIAADKALAAFKAARTILFIIGGFGLIGIAFAAIFGKLNWKWFGALAVGLAIVAAAGAIVQYATTNQNDNGTTGHSNFGDTYDQNANNF